MKDHFAHFIWLGYPQIHWLIIYIYIYIIFRIAIWRYTPLSYTPMLNHERDREICPLIGALLREGSDSDADSEAHGTIWQSWMDYLQSFSVVFLA